MKLIFKHVGSIRPLKSKLFTDENYFLRWLSNEITKRILDGEIEYTNNYLDFTGKLTFQDNTTED